MQTRLDAVRPGLTRHGGAGEEEMNLSEAKAECERWLAYLAREQEKSAALQKLATERRAGRCDDEEARRRLVAIEKDITVYDGASLADAVRVMIREIGRLRDKLHDARACQPEREAIMCAEIKRQEKQLYRLGEELAKDKLEIGRLRLLLKRWVVSCDHEEHDLLAETRSAIGEEVDVSQTRL